MKKIGTFATYPSSEIDDSIVSIGFECLDRELFNPEKCYDLPGKSGIRHARCQTGWAKCEKTPGVYDFSWLDDIVNNLLSRGVKPWFNVGFGNPIYMKNPPNPTCVGCVPLLYGEEIYSAWKRWLRAMSEHYSGRITEFEIWNEPDIPQFWYPEAPSAEKYAVLVKDASDIIRSVIPSARIGACASRINFQYAERLASNLAPGTVDFFSFHAYSMVPEENYSENVSFLRRIFRQSGHGEIEIRQGEGGFPSWFPDNHWLHPHAQGSERQQAVWQLRRYFLDAAAGIRLSSFFQMADMWEKPYEKSVEVIRKPAAHGILNGLTYTPKKSYLTISRLANFFAGNVRTADCYFTGRADSLSPVERCAKKYLSYKINGNRFHAYYLPTDIQSEELPSASFNATIYETDGEPRIKRPALLDLYSGEIFDLSENSVRYDKILVLNGLPITDYPLVICDADSVKITE